MACDSLTWYKVGGPKFDSYLSVDYCSYNYFVFEICAEPIYEGRVMFYSFY